MQNARAFLKRTTVKELGGMAARKEYLDALSLFWHKKGDAVIEHAAEAILAGENSSYGLPFYRLWLEQLACNKEYAAIRELISHFKQLARHKPQQAEAWLALRALAHLELDDWEACQLYAPTVLKATREPYSLEFAMRYHLRCWDGSSPLPLTFLACEASLADYFHWQALAQVLMLNGAEEELEAVLAHTSHLFVGAPLEDLFTTHLMLEAGRPDAAKAPSLRLAKKYPTDLDTQVTAAYCQWLNGDYTPAQKQLQKASALPGSKHDPDVWTLKAACEQALASTPAEQKRARAFARHALRLRQVNALPSHDLYQVLADAEALTQLDLDRAGGALQQWLVCLSPRRTHEFAAGEASPTLVVGLGSKPRRNDLVFFAGPQTSGNGELRVLGLYAVESNPHWDAEAGRVVLLKLLQRFAEPLLVSLPASELRPVRGSKGRARTTLPGCFHLDEKSFDAITAAVHELASEGGAQNSLRVARSS